MKIQLKLGLVGFSPGWIIILDQIGIDYELIEDVNQIDLKDFSLLIITKKIDRNDIKIIASFLEMGGSIITNSILGKVFFEFKTKKHKVKYLLTENTSIYKNIGLIDFYSDFHIPISNDLNFLDNNLKIAEGSLSCGSFLILPFQIDDLILSQSSKRKRFYFDRSELPSEVVSSVSKGKIRDLIFNSLLYLFNKKNLPFVQKWYFPNGLKSVFIFRLDTDFCNEEEISLMYKNCKNNKISASWFIDTISENRVKKYGKLENQEIGIHCERHKVFPNRKQNRLNIKESIEKLKKQDIDFGGYVAPFGDWNEELDDVLNELNFQYSSEFALDYDDLPFFPFVKTKFSNVLQIPIHPISLGRLIKSHFSQEEILNYFLDVINEKYKFHEPIIFYHHPHHKCFDILHEIFNYINEFSIPNLTMIEFADWWKKRQKAVMHVDYENNKLFISTDNNDVFLRVIYHDKEAIFPVQKQIDLSDLKFKKMNYPLMKKNIADTRKWTWRDVLNDYRTIKSKRKA